MPAVGLEATVGFLLVMAGTASHGQGHETVYAQIAASVKPASAPSADYRRFADELVNRHRQAAGPRGLVSRWRQLIAR